MCDAAEEQNAANFIPGFVLGSHVNPGDIISTHSHVPFRIKYKTLLSRPVRSVNFISRAILGGLSSRGSIPAP